MALRVVVMAAERTRSTTVIGEYADTKRIHRLYDPADEERLPKEWQKRRRFDGANGNGTD
jgi:hypothetical protein